MKGGHQVREKKSIIEGAEYILHGGDYNPDQWLDRADIIDEDFRLMKLAGCNTFSIGIFSWTSYEAEEGVCDFSWLDRIMDRMAAEGHKVFLATPSGSKPAWLSAKYPEICRVMKNGQREPHRERHNHCWSSPVYLTRLQALTTALAERYKDHPALSAWHISNEYGGACYCDLCLNAFQKWLKKKYGTIEHLNKCWQTAFWNHTFTDWAEIDPRDESIDALLTDWSRFNTDQAVDFYRAECAPLARICPDIPRTTNLMQVNEPLNYWELTKELDFIANDSYPGLDRNKPDLWKDVAVLSMNHDFMRTAAKRTGRPWMLMECTPSTVQWKPAKLKAPGMHRAEVMNAIAHGAEGVLYFQWRKGAGGFEKLHGAVVDHEGSEKTRVFQDVAAAGEDFRKMAAVLGSEVKAEVAVVYDWESRWQLRDSSGTLSHHRLIGNDAGYNPGNHYRELWRRSVATDIISPEHELSPYKLVIIPQLFMLKPGVAAKLRKYVADGGILVGTYYTGYVDETGTCLSGGWPGGRLRELFGVWNEEQDLIPPGANKAIRFQDGQESRVSLIAEIIHAEGADILAEYAEDFYTGNPAVTCNRFGDGTAFYIAAEPDSSGYRMLYDRILAAAGLDTPLICSGKPDSVSIRVRENAETCARFVFITNWSDRPANLDIGKQKILPFGSEQELTGFVHLKPFESLTGRIVE